MELHSLKPNVKQSRTRRGRGNGSNKGTFSGRGCNGQNARAGGGVRPGFEGGQTPLIQRMPKLRGFRNPNRVETQVVSLTKLEEHFKDGEKVTFDLLIEKDLINKNNAKIKILNGEITKKLEIDAGILISATAKEAIEKVGGKVL
jgi:large subunit ribosomal protein L15